jgi:surfeit locus 1 family protein
MLRHLLSPRMLASHLLVLAVVAGCVTAGLWQWDRLGQARAVNELLAQRMQAEPVDLADLLDERPDVGALEYRRVEATGTFRPDEEVVQRNQNEPQGNQGLHVLTPLELADGSAVLVRRGWVPTGHDEPPVTSAPPPDGEVTVRGLLELSVDQPTFGARDPEDGHLERVFHADVDRLDRQVEGSLFPMVLRLEEPRPPDGELPYPAGTPSLDEANHLSYAVQWFTFAALAAITYGAWLWRRSRGGTPDGRPPAAGHEAPAHPDAPLPSPRG